MKNVLVSELHQYSMNMINAARINNVTFKWMSLPRGILSTRDCSADRWHFNSLNLMQLILAYFAKMRIQSTITKETTVITACFVCRFDDDFGSNRNFLFLSFILNFKAIFIRQILGLYSKAKFPHLGLYCQRITSHHIWPCLWIRGDKCIQKNQVFIWLHFNWQ